MANPISRAVGLAMTLAALLSAGCGGTNTTPTTAPASTGATTTKAHYIALAEEICATLVARERPLRVRQESLRSLSGAAAGQTFVALAQQVVALSRAASAKLAAIPPPAADRAAVEKLLSSFAAEITDATAIADAAAKQESTPGEDAETALRRSIAANAALADELGMRGCIGG